MKFFENFSDLKLELKKNKNPNYQKKKHCISFNYNEIVFTKRSKLKVNNFLKIFTR